MKTHRQQWRTPSLQLVALALLTITITGCLHDDEKDTVDPPGEMTPSTTTLSAILSGALETDSVTTNAAGYGSVTVDQGTRAITGEVTFTGLTATTAHIHTGAAGVSGAPAITLTVDNSTHSAKIPAGTVLTQQQYDDLLAGKLYYNVHSSTYSSGEIRGQIGRVVMKATLDGAQEAPPVTTAATGTAMVIVDPATRGISGSVTTTGVSATAAHIHTGAAGVSGAPAVTLTLGTDSAAVPEGETLTQTEYENLLTGKLYVNVHSAANSTGEIRGQIGPVAMVATLDGAQEVPSVTTTASGKAVFVVDPVTRALSGGVGFAGVSATTAHIHTGATGVTGAPAVTLTVDNNTSTATVPANVVLTQTQYDDLLAGNLYVNVHSTTYANGEIRGQLGRP